MIERKERVGRVIDQLEIINCEPSDPPRPLGPSGESVMARLIRTGATRRLKVNGIGLAGGNHIPEALSAPSTQIIDLDLSRNNLQSQGVVKVKKKK
jgi:hypothetical protein